MVDTIYVDQLTNISLYSGVVRLEFSVVETPPKGNEEPAIFRVSHNLVMPLEAFVKAFGAGKALMEKLVQEKCSENRTKLRSTTRFKFYY